MQYQDYFNWEEKKKDVVWFDGGKFNAAYNAVDVNAEQGRGNKLALLHESEDGKVSQYTFFDIVKQSNKFANLLTSYGVGKGDRVFIFLPRIPELYFAFLGILKTGAISGTLFSAFQHDALRDRLSNSGAK